MKLFTKVLSTALFAASSAAMATSSAANDNNAPALDKIASTAWELAQEVGMPESLRPSLEAGIKEQAAKALSEIKGVWSQCAVAVQLAKEDGAEKYYGVTSVIYEDGTIMAVTVASPNYEHYQEKQDLFLNGSVDKTAKNQVRGGENLVGTFSVKSCSFFSSVMNYIKMQRTQVLKPYEDPNSVAFSP